MSNTKQVQTPVFIPLGVADPKGTTGYVFIHPGTLRAISLDLGKILWSRVSVSKPLIVYKDLLVGLRLLSADTNSFQIDLMESNENGTITLSSEIIRFPGWVNTDEKSNSFSMDVFLNGDHLILKWKARQLYRGGAPPPSHIEQLNSKQDQGIFQVDLINGKVKPLSNEIRNNLSMEGLTDPGNNLSVISTWENMNYYYALLSGVSEENVTYYLMSWDHSFKALHSPAFLTEGKAVVPYLSKDKNYLFFHQEKVSDENDYWFWSIFSACTAKQEGKVSIQQRAQYPCMINSRLIYLLDLQKGPEIETLLKCMDINENKLLWELQISERPYTRPFALRQ